MMWDEICDVGASATTRDGTEVLVMGGYRVKKGVEFKRGNSLMAIEPVRPRS